MYLKIFEDSLDSLSTSKAWHKDDLSFLKAGDKARRRRTSKNPIWIHFGHLSRPFVAHMALIPCDFQGGVLQQDLGWALPGVGGRGSPSQRGRRQIYNVITVYHCAVFSQSKSSSSIAYTCMPPPSFSCGKTWEMNCCDEAGEIIRVDLGCKNRADLSSLSRRRNMSHSF